MLPLMEFIFRDIWHFLGTLLLLVVIGNDLAVAFSGRRREPPTP